MAEVEKIPEVIIAGQEGPVEVTIGGSVGVIDRSAGSLAPTTTKQQDITHAGQRTINLIWEKTQSEIARIVVYAGLGINVCVIVCLIVLRREISATMLTVIVASLGAMNTVMGIIIGFYFSRTNHSAIGGVGAMPVQSQYTGR